MATIDVRARDKDELARSLGWFSVALGAAQLVVPKAMCKLVGATGEGTAPLLMRLFGLRELAQGLAILVRPRPTVWVWSRVAGDALDVSALGVVAARNPGRRLRAAVAAANVLPIAVADVFEARHLSAQQGPPQRGRRIRKAVTINRPRDVVEQAWSEAQELRNKVDTAGAAVLFREASGDRGTELVVEYVEDSRAGDLGSVAKKLTGGDLPTQLADDLRRLKQRIETGEVVRSDASPDGHLLADHLMQRAAQPLESVR
ncbi:MAG TPA: hypothetical protein VFA05_00305 [Gaiellaceae bacterium]|nr:hypothetical protein [Gaiellaceae bacterium]